MTNSIYMINAVLFDYYGVIGNDPLVARTKRHQLNEWQLNQLRAVCDQSDAGMIDLATFYEQAWPDCRNFRRGGA
jgi:hypothetical protein